MSQVFRTRFGKDIVAEYVPPTRPSRKVAILWSGMPSVPKYHEVLRVFSQAGYWAFSPRYRGTWESSGSLFAESPHLDALLVLNLLPRGFKNLWTGKKIQFKPSTVHLFGSSFGGPAALLASRHPLVEKVVTSSGVVDWRVQGRTEPLPALKRMVKTSFGKAYRFKDSDWRKLGSRAFYNPADVPAAVAGEKVLLVHSKDDDVVPYGPTTKFAKEVGAKLWLRPTGGHLTSKLFLQPASWRRIMSFLKS